MSDELFTNELKIKHQEFNKLQPYNKKISFQAFLVKLLKASIDQGKL